LDSLPNRRQSIDEAANAGLQAVCGRPHQPIDEAEPGAANCNTGSACLFHSLQSKEPSFLDTLTAMLAPDPDGRANMLMPFEAVGFPSPADHPTPYAHKRSPDPHYALRRLLDLQAQCTLGQCRRILETGRHRWLY
jgi:hypothetical protein